jgi:small conductance mechanosensitive channel
MFDGSVEVDQIVRDLENINFIGILITALVAWLLIMIVQHFFPWLAERLPGGFRFYILPLAPILRVLILLIALVRIVTFVIQPTVQNVFAITGALAVAVGFAFKDYVSSVIAGVVALYERPYRPGDWIKFGEEYGEVQELGLRAIKMRTADDDIVTIPHGRIWDKNVVNANDGRRTLQCVTEFFLQPNHDAHLARQLLYDVAVTSPYINLSRAVEVLVFEKPWATRYIIRAYPVDARQQFQFISDLTVRGKAALAMRDMIPAALPPQMEAGPELTTNQR